MAVLDASTANSSDSRLIQRHTMALVNMSAHLISRWNFLNEYSQSWILRFHSRPEFVGLLHEALMAMDDDGNILAVNESALRAARLLRPRKLAGRRVDREDSSSSISRRSSSARNSSRARSGRCAIWLTAGDSSPSRARRCAAVRAQRRAGAAESVRRGRRSAAASASSSMSARMLQMRKNLACGRQLFAKQVPILLQGATGTGKEAFAKSLHRGGLWSDKPFVTVNCAAIPESLIESELFGYTRGAFTGAAKEGRDRQDSAIQRRHAVSRRDRRHAADAADAAAAGHRGAGSRAARQRSGHSGQSARDQRDAPRRASDDPGRRIPRGPLLPAEWDHAASSAVARSRRQGGVDPHAIARGEHRARTRSRSTKRRSAS